MPANNVIVITHDNDISVMTRDYDAPSLWNTASLIKVDPDIDFNDNITDDFILSLMSQAPYGYAIAKNEEGGRVVYSKRGVRVHFDVYVSEHYVALFYNDADCVKIHRKHSVQLLNSMVELRPFSYYSTETSIFLGCVPRNVFRVGDCTVEVYPHDVYHGIEGDCLILKDGVLAGGFGMHSGSRLTDFFPANVRAGLNRIHSRGYSGTVGENLAKTRGVYVTNTARVGCTELSRALKTCTEIDSNLSFALIYQRPANSRNSTVLQPYVVVDKRALTSRNWSDFITARADVVAELSAFGYTVNSRLVFDGSAYADWGLDTFINQTDCLCKAFTSGDAFILNALTDFESALALKLTEFQDHVVNTTQKAYNTAVQRVNNRHRVYMLLKTNDPNRVHNAFTKFGFQGTMQDIDQLNSTVTAFINSLSDAELNTFALELNPSASSMYIVNGVLTLSLESGEVQNFTNGNVSSDYSFDIQLMKYQLDDIVAFHSDGGVNVPTMRKYGLGLVEAGYHVVNSCITYRQDSLGDVNLGDAPNASVDDYIELQPTDVLYQDTDIKVNSIKNGLDTSISSFISSLHNTLKTGAEGVLIKSDIWRCYNYHTWVKNDNDMFYTWKSVPYRWFPPIYIDGNSNGKGQDEESCPASDMVVYGVDEQGVPYTQNWIQSIKMDGLKVNSVYLKNPGTVAISYDIKLKMDGPLLIHRDASRGTLQDDFKRNVVAVISRLNGQEGAVVETSCDGVFRRGSDMLGPSWPRTTDWAFNYDPEAYPQTTNSHWSYEGQYKEGFGMYFTVRVKQDLTISAMAGLMWSDVSHNLLANANAYQDFFAKVLTDMYNKGKSIIISEGILELLYKLSTVGYGEFLDLDAYDPMNESVFPIEMAPYFSNLNFNGEEVAMKLEELADAKRPRDYVSGSFSYDQSVLFEGETAGVGTDSNGVSIEYKVPDVLRSFAAQIRKVKFVDDSKIPYQFRESALTSQDTRVDPNTVPLYLEIV